MCPRHLSPIEAHEAIERLLIWPKSLTFTRHGSTRAAERHFDVFDVLRVLREGTVATRASWDAKYQEWVYSVSGRDADGDPLTVKVVIDEERRQLRIVTGHD